MATKTATPSRTPDKQRAEHRPPAPITQEPFAQTQSADGLQQAVADPRAARPSDILMLQRRYGNQAVQRLLAQGSVQAKLTVGPAGDHYEQEADTRQKAQEEERTRQESITLTLYNHREGDVEQTMTARDTRPENIQPSEFQDPVNGTEWFEIVVVDVTTQFTVRKAEYDAFMQALQGRTGI